MSSTIVDVDPKDLVVADNVRKDTKLTKEFVASIKEHGVLVPILAQQGLQGYEVLDGQRRTLAAVEAGVALVPAVLVPAFVKDAERVVDQLVVNEHREHLTLAENVAALKQLELFGMPASQIAKKTGVAKKVVDTALRVAGSAAATNAVAEFSLTLDQAATLTEFEDSPATVASLVESARRGFGFEHQVQRARDERVDAAARAEMLKEIEAKGLQPLVESPRHDDPRFRRIEEVYPAGTRRAHVTVEQALALAPEDVLGYPRKVYGGWSEDNTRQPDRYEVGYAVQNWASHGWTVTDYGDSSTQQKGPLSDEEKAERKQARENTKDWVSASAVRLAWLQELLQRKSMPTGWEQLVAAHALRHGAGGGYTPTQWKTIIALLQLGEPGDLFTLRMHVEKHFESNRGRAAQVALAAAVGTIEGGFEFDRKGWAQKEAPAYLSQLAFWGYELSELEQSLVDAK